MDTIDQLKRSAVMAKVRGKNTRPEIAVRKLVFAAGYRYRLHVRTLPGSPDLVFFARRKIIFVHGCFWHRHTNCKFARLPKSRVEFWSEKLNNNKTRDERIYAALTQTGWDVLVVWECQITNLILLEERIRIFLGPTRMRCEGRAGMKNA